jgi:hypothetical protein
VICCQTLESLWFPILNKSEIADEITDLLRLPSVHFSTGSTEPKELFLLISESLGLGIDSILPKPVMARRIVESSGQSWLADYESTGGTVTLKGLQAVKSSVEYYLANRPEIS